MIKEELKQLNSLEDLYKRVFRIKRKCMYLGCKLPSLLRQHDEEHYEKVEHKIYNFNRPMLTKTDEETVQTLENILDNIKADWPEWV